jgi:hypothetical protein
MSDISDKPIDSEVIDSLCSVIELQKVISNALKNDNVNANLTLEKLKTICQEQLLQLHPDKKAVSTIKDLPCINDNHNLDLEKVLNAWKFLSKYPVDGENTLMRQIFARQHQLAEVQTRNAISKPLWKIVVLESFNANGKNLESK